VSVWVSNSILFPSDYHIVRANMQVGEEEKLSEEELIGMLT
jgi:hypothetical protein